MLDSPFPSRPSYEGLGRSTCLPPAAHFFVAETEPGQVVYVIRSFVFVEIRVPACLDREGMVGVPANIVVDRRSADPPSTAIIVEGDKFSEIGIRHCARPPSNRSCRLTPLDMGAMWLVAGPLYLAGSVFALVRRLSKHLKGDNKNGPLICQPIKLGV